MTAATSSVGDDLRAREVATIERALDSVGPWVERVFAPRASGLANLRADGAALLVGNHSGGVLAMLEPLVLAHAMRAELGASEMPRTLSHEILWHTPLASWLASMGAVRASEANASALLAQREKVLVYPGGDREAFRPFADRHVVTLGGRRGYVRLALREGVPIIPVVTAGMHSGFVSLSDGHALARQLAPASLRVGVLPVTLGFPFGLSVGLPAPYVPIDARVRIRALPPIRFTRLGAAAAADEAYVDACHRIVLGRMQAALDALVAERRADRRGSLHRRLDGLLDGLDRLMDGPHTSRRTANVTALPVGAPPAARPLRRAA